MTSEFCTWHVLNFERADIGRDWNFRRAIPMISDMHSLSEVGCERRLATSVGC